jgi:hypothetical protein
MAKKTDITTKAKNALSNTGKAIVSNPNTSLYLGVGVLALVAVYFSYNSLQKVRDAILDDPDSGGGKIDIKNPSNILLGATITRAQAQTGAARILSAIDSVGQLTTSEFEEVKRVLRNRNAIDYFMISEAFGTPKRSPVTGEESFWLLGERLNLSQWLSIEAKPWQMTQLKQLLPTVF